MNLLYSGEQVAARLQRSCVVTIATMESKGYFKADLKADISARNVASYNNSFEALLKDLKMYRKNGCRVLLLSGSFSARCFMLSENSSSTAWACSRTLAGSSTKNKGFRFPPARRKSSGSVTVSS